jgi:RNA polymerase sigma factor (sigma-70 family)
MLTDIDLLRRYTLDGSEAAFGELVTRHINLVHSTALRILNSDEHRARDVVQSVFTDLARKASLVCDRSDDGKNAKSTGFHSISAWLYTSTRFAAAKVARAEQIRRKHEQKAHAMNHLLHGGSAEPEWSELRPVLDDAIGELDETDRGALLLRFFQGMNFRSVGTALGLSEDAARMRVSRAVEKLRELLAKRGVTTTAGALSVTLAAHVVEAAPVGLAAAITCASLSAVTLTTSTPMIGLQIMASTKFKISLAALLAGGVVTPLIIQTTAMSTLRVENEALRAQLASAQASELKPQTNISDSVEASRSESQESELLRLRGEVTRLRADAARTRPVPPAQANASTRFGQANVGGYEMYDGDLLSPRHADTIKMMKMVGIALRRLEQNPAISAETRSMPFKEDNDLRTELRKSISLPDEEWNQFEILVPNLDSLTQNKSDPGLIVARSKDPLQTPDGRWVRVYTRVDGSVLNLIHDSATKALDFGELENSTRSNQP